jgi:MFS family permease
MERRDLPVLTLLCTASFLAVADTTIVSIALPSLRADIGLSASDSQWVLNAYALVFGGLLLVLGRVGDLGGRRRLFLSGLSVFAVGSLLAGLSPTASLLVVGRGLQGLGAAAFVPASLALLTVAFPDERRRSRAVGMYGAMAGLGFVAGMVGGGVITQLWGWRWVLLVNVPVVLLMYAAGVLLLRESRAVSRTRLDIGGGLTATGGLVALVYAVTAFPDRGLDSGTVTAAVGGLLLIAWCAAIERRHPAPLLPGDVVGDRDVLGPNVALLLQSMIGISWLYLLTLYLQEVRGSEPVVAGLLFAPMTIAGVVGSMVAGRLAPRTGVRRTGLGGLAGVAVGLVVMVAGMDAEGSVALVVVGMVVGEAGFMFSNVSLTLAGTAALQGERSGLAAGLLNTSAQLGAGLGLAAAAVVLGTGPRTPAGNPAEYTDALRWGLVVCLGCCLSAALVVARHVSPRVTAGTRPDV